MTTPPSSRTTKQPSQCQRTKGAFRLGRVEGLLSLLCDSSTLSRVVSVAASERAEEGRGGASSGRRASAMDVEVLRRNFVPSLSVRGRKVPRNDHRRCETSVRSLAWWTRISARQRLIVTVSRPVGGVLFAL